MIEVKNAEGRRFSLEQLVAALQSRRPEGADSARDLALETLSIVRDFSQGEPQEDDLTVLAVHLSPFRKHTPEEELAQAAT